MSFHAENPIKIVIDGTFKNLITKESWPGKTPVEFRYAEHVSRTFDTIWQNHQ